ncbi:spondin domain-containing protein [Candidatus Poribacteria bacterium]|nr:spondin domain-containing protein [Candidatus Poribacteria bacterium]
MGFTRLKFVLQIIFVLCFVGTFAITATAQDYYPTVVGNTWVFLDADGSQERTYTIEEAEGEADGIIILRIYTETLGTDTVDDDVYYISDDNGDLLLHRTHLDEGAFGIAAAILDPPSLFFPADLPIGRTWDVKTITELDLVGTANTTSTITVVDIEDIETPAGTFENCVKLEIFRKVVTAVTTLRLTSYQWLAPDVGPVKYVDDQEIVYELQSYTLFGEQHVEDPPTETPEIEEPPVEIPEIEEPPVETPPIETPEIEEPPVEIPTDQEPIVELPPGIPSITEQEFEITLTNLTVGEPGIGGQIFSPPIFATHLPGAKLAPLGEPAIPALVALAENGDVSGILQIATAIAANTDVSENLLIPGNSVTVKLKGNQINTSLTVAAMLVSTNDGFIIADGIPLFDEDGKPVTTTLELMTYDAGSEDNTELASDIPGPVGLDADADPEGSNARVPTEGGVVSVHPGIQGVGDVGEAFAWTEPTAMISIKPVSDEVPVPESNFDITLAQGLNMISIPLMPSEPYSAKSLSTKLGASIVIKLDAATQTFVGYSYAEEGDGFEIDGNSGYIVNTPAGGKFTFSGTAWMNDSEPKAAPQISNIDNAWAFIVTTDLHGVQNSQAYTITAKNLRTGVVATERVKSNRSSVSAVWADMNRKSVVQIGDKLEIALLDEHGTIVSGPFERTVQSADIHNAFLTVQLQVGDVRPKNTILGQNYPNPFNPETWIPYQLSHDSDVTINIYDVSGQSIRTMNLGHQSIGSYMAPAAAAYWDGKNGEGEFVSSGIYFYTLQTKNFSATRRMVILK